MSALERLGEFEVESEIGRGGFGIVYRARQTSLDRPVALKVLYRHLVGTEEQVTRFEREARAAARLDHPGLVTVYSWGREGDDFYIAEKLVGEGRTLADYLDELREGTAPPKGYFRFVARLVADVAGALDHAHARGVVHRDIKPSNILLDDDFQAFIGDFGLAKMEDGLELSRTGDFVGSPFYMSPEQADSKRGPIDARTDVYALGVTLYELLTRTQPHQGKSAHEIMRRILNEDPKSPRRHDERVPRDLETICLKALEKDPDRRYASAGEMAEDLQAFLYGEPISAVPIGALTRTVRFMRRKRQTVGSVLLAVALLAASVWGYRQYEALRQQSEQIESTRKQAEGVVDAFAEQRRIDETFAEEKKAIDQEFNRRLQAAIANQDLAEVGVIQDWYANAKAELDERRRRTMSAALDFFRNNSLLALGGSPAAREPDAAGTSEGGGAGISEAGGLLSGLTSGLLDIMTPAAANPDAFASDDDDEGAEAGPPWVSFVGTNVTILPPGEERGTRTRGFVLPSDDEPRAARPSSAPGPPGVPRPGKGVPPPPP